MKDLYIRLIQCRKRPRACLVAFLILISMITVHWYIYPRTWQTFRKPIKTNGVYESQSTSLSRSNLLKNRPTQLKSSILNENETNSSPLVNIRASIPPLLVRTPAPEVAQTLAQKTLKDGESKPPSSEVGLKTTEETTKLSTNSASAATIKLSKSTAAATKKLSKSTSTTTTKLPASTSSTITKLSKSTSTTTTKLPASTSATTTKLSKSTLTTTTKLSKSTTASTTKLPASTSATTTKLSKSTLTTTTKLPKSTTASTTKLPASTSATTTKLPKSTLSTTSKLSKSTSTTTTKLPASTSATTTKLSKSTLSTTTKLLKSTTASITKLPASTSAITTKLPKSTLSTTSKLSKSTSTTTTKLPASTSAITTKLSKSTLSTTSKLSKSTLSTTSKLSKSTSTTTTKLPASTSATTTKLSKSTLSTITKLSKPTLPTKTKLPSPSTTTTKLPTSTSATTAKPASPVQTILTPATSSAKTTTTTTTSSAKAGLTPTAAATLSNETTRAATSQTSTPGEEGCPFQNLDPFDPETMKHITSFPQVNCSTGLPILVYIDQENNLQVNFTKVNKTIGELDYCQYTRVELSDEHDSKLRPFNWSQKFLFRPMPLADEDEQVYVQCFLNHTVVSQTFKGRIIKRAKVEERSEADYKRHVEENNPKETMSVLIVGMDGMSKQNLARALPKTRNFIINKLNAKELNKFNKVGDNTYPNVVVLHSGLNESDILTNFTTKQYFDVIEDKFIWHDYQKAGYRTGMGFDVTWITAYHYVKKGWKHPSFDYYIRPLTLALDNNKDCRKGGLDCVGDVPEVKVLQDYFIQMVSSFNNTKSKPYFIYNFYTKLSHDDQNGASKGDDIYLHFFQQLKEKRVLNNTIVIFFSDHGTRFSDFRRTFNGKVETNTPFVFFMFPPWFEKKYPAVMETFQTNQNRLTTFFDIHQTLKELLVFNGKTKKGDISSRAISLFDEIPMERTCSHANIPIEYCNCKLLFNRDVSEKINNSVSTGLLGAIVKRTEDNRDICAALSLKHVKSILTLSSDGEKALYYQVTITTKPGGGMYEALMKHNPETDTSSLVGDIVRLNLYRGQDACVDKLELKLYCFCKS